MSFLRMSARHVSPLDRKKNDYFTLAVKIVT